MAIYTIHDTNAVPMPDNCYLCNKSIGNTCIYWVSYETIAFHPDCAISFCRRLLTDAEDYYSRELDPKPKPQVRKRK